MPHLQTRPEARPLRDLPMDLDLSTFYPPDSAHLLIDLESQQDDLLRQLDDLNRRIEQVIVGSQVHIRTVACAAPTPPPTAAVA